MAAAADADPDYPGSCGRCYQVKCTSGIVAGEARVWGSVCKKM